MNETNITYYETIPNMMQKKKKKKVNIILKQETFHSQFLKHQNVSKLCMYTQDTSTVYVRYDGVSFKKQMKGGNNVYNSIFYKKPDISF